MLKIMKYKILFIIFAIAMILGACGEQKEEGWDLKEYEKLEDIISIRENTQDENDEVFSYNVRYRSDECEVVSYLSIPKECLENRKAYPCIIYNRGGNRLYGANTPSNIARTAEAFDKIVFASQYRGVGSGTGQEEFGGADVNDVIKLIDLCEKFSFVDMNELYMMGISRGGMMTYQAIRKDERIKKAVVVSGLADCFISYEDREDMRTVYKELVGGTPEELPEEFEKRSATYWANELKCPVLIIHSKQDKKVSYKQAEKMVQLLETSGMEYKFISYEDDVHGLHMEDTEHIMEWFQ